jgi:NAD(P)-dependent dehydrogenase (short-subunit alcohol dehydrogenase family)
MNITFANKVALVTGAASGLGLATARAFADAGASVVLADLHEKEVQTAAKDLANRGHKARHHSGLSSPKPFRRNQVIHAEKGGQER